MDVYTSGNRMRVRITRFLAPLRETIQIDPIDGNLSVDKTLVVPVEVSSCYFDPEDSFLRMIAKEDFGSFAHQLEDEIQADHYFMFYTNSSGYTAKGISNPHAKKMARRLVTSDSSFLWGGTNPSEKAFFTKNPCQFN
jgi:hypothetical protein